MLRIRTKSPANLLLWTLLPLLGILLLWPQLVAAADAVGQFTAVDGRVDVMRNGQLPAEEVQVGSAVYTGDFIRTRSKSTAELRFVDGNVLKVAPKSRIDIALYLTNEQGDKRTIKLQRGKLQSIIKPLPEPKPDAVRYEVQTPNAVAGVRGTNYFSSYAQGTSSFVFQEGRGYGYNLNRPDQVMPIQAGQALTVVGADQAPQLRPATQAELDQHAADVSGDGTAEAGSDSGSDDGTDSAAEPAESQDGASSSSTEGDDSQEAVVEGSQPASNDNSDAVVETAGDAVSADAVGELTLAELPTETALLPDSSDPITTTTDPTPVTNEPIVSEPPPITDPASGDPITKDPVATDPPPTDTTPTDPVTTDPPPTDPPPVDPPVTDPTPTATFASVWGASPLYRGTAIDGTSNLLELFNDQPLSGKLVGYTDPWSSSTTAVQLSGSWSLTQPVNHYWCAQLVSQDPANATNLTPDGGAYFGYLAGADANTSLLEGNFHLIYVDPSGNYGILRGAFGQNGTASIDLTNSAWQADGSWQQVLLGNTGGMLPSSLPADWDTSVMTTINTPVIMEPVGFDGSNNESMGFFFDGTLDISSWMTNRADANIAFSYLPIGGAPSFGVWQTESFGSYQNPGTSWHMFTAGYVGPTPDSYFMDIYAQPPEQVFEIHRYGDWRSDGMISGEAKGVWLDVVNGQVYLLSGDVSGSYNASEGSFGAHTTGSWLTADLFLANLTAAQNLGFADLLLADLHLSGSNTMGSIDIPSLQLFTDSDGDLIGQWAATGITGSYTDPYQETLSLALTDLGGNVDLFGSFEMRRIGISPTTGDLTWIGNIDLFGPVDTVNGTVTEDRFGYAVGIYDETNQTFSGTAAGLSLPIDHFSLINAGLYRFDQMSGTYVTDADLIAAMGGFSLWSSTMSEMLGMEMFGLVNPAAGLIGPGYVFSSEFSSYDPASNAAMTFDGGAYFGFMGGSLVVGPTPDEPFMARQYGLYMDPQGNMGVILGKNTGYLDTVGGNLDAHGEMFPIFMTSGPLDGITPALFNSNITRQTSSVSSGYGSFLDSMYNPTSSFINVSYDPQNTWETAAIGSTTDWGIASLQFGGIFNAPDAFWSLDLSADDTQRFLDLTIYGQNWSNNRLDGHAEGFWADMATAAPTTGIFIGETIGTFDPVATTWQAVTGGVWLESTLLCNLASTAAGQQTLDQLQIPSVEIGRATLGYDDGNIAVSLNDVVFLAPTGGDRATVWATGDVSGAYSVDPFNQTLTLIQTSGSNTGGLSADMMLYDMGANKWGADIMTGSGNVGAYPVFDLSGVAAGTYTGTPTSGTLTGTAAGVVK